MEFHTLTRRELQALCKKNKIPANTTNAAMAEALKSLQIVEGIEELMQASQSETAQSSIDSMEGVEITSPYAPPTGGRSTRQRNVLKEEAEAVTSVTTTRRTTRKTAAKVSYESQVDTLETPALVSQTSRRKGQMASACRKMDSQLKECIEEEEKKDVLMTPAPLGVTSRRRRVEEGTVQKVYSTRRSVRLAEKNVNASEVSELFNNELPTKDCENQEVNLKEGDELSGVTGDDAITNMENYEKQEKSEVVSAEELDITHEEESCNQFAVEAQPDEEISDNIEFLGGEDSTEPVNMSEEVKQSKGSVCVCTSETETTVQNSEELDIEIDVAGDSVDVCTSEIEITVQNSEELDIEIAVAGDSVEPVLLETKDAIAAEDDAEFCYDKEIDTENLNVTLVKLTELRLKQEDAEILSPQIKVADDIEEADSEQTECDEMQTLELEESEIAADKEQASEATEKNSPSKQISGAEDVPLEMGVGLTEQITTSQVVQPNRYCAMILLSDNKENTVSGAKDSAENLKELNDLSVRKLTKMLKEKLEITKKEVVALPRAALHVVPEIQGKK